MEYSYSFIIPHHNSPQLLERLLSSIPQRNDIEIIVIDDNSDKNLRPNIIRNDVKYIQIDAEKTTGAGGARNKGLAAASGKWLLFADADDFYAENFLDVLDDYVNDDIDILFFNCMSVDSDTLQPHERAMPIHELNLRCQNNDTDAIERMRFKVQVPWIKMVRGQYVRNYNFQFEEINNGNDIQFSYLINYFTDRIKIDKRIVYICTFYSGSITFKKRSFVFYKCSLENLYKKNCFRNFINHKEWNQSAFRLFVSSLKHCGFKVFIKLLLYFICNYVKIQIIKRKYINIIKKIEGNNE